MGCRYIGMYVDGAWELGVAIQSTRADVVWIVASKRRLEMMG